MPVRIIRKPKPAAELRLEPTADKEGALVWLGDLYIGRIVRVSMTGGWLAYPPRYLAERSDTKDGALAYLAQHKDKA